MKSFDVLFNNYLEEMANPRGAITIPSSEIIDSAPKPEWINKFTESDINPKTGERRKPNPRDGKYTGEDAWKALQLFVKSGSGAGKVYSDNARMQAAIYDFLKYTAGWSSSPAEKWMKTLGNYLYGLNLINQTPDESGNNRAGEALPQASSEDIEDSEQEQSSPDESDPSGVEPSPDELRPQSDREEFENATAGLDLDPVEETLLTIISSLGGKEITNKQILNDPSTPIELREDPNKLREVLGRMARDRKVISRGDTGWNVIEVESPENLAVFDRDEDSGTDYGALDTIQKYASDYSGSGRGNPFLDHTNLKQIYKNLFKSGGLIKG